MVVTRFAPSPTGYLHIGGLRTALFSYLWARKHSGKFLLRIEDTDLSRNSEEAKDAILKAFHWVGMDHDGEIVYQSQRFDLYKKYVAKLLDEGKAYYCYMTKEELETLREEQRAAGQQPMYDNRYRDGKLPARPDVEPVVRLKTPLEGSVTVQDGVKGDVTFEWSRIDDYIIARSDGTPTYNLVVAIDDALMGVNHVIRGDDHLSNTPKQIAVYDALGFDLPKFFHVPMIHNMQGKKLSKRDGATDVMEYKTQGYLPEALLNFLVRLGWSHGDQEIFSMAEMLDLFSPDDINKSASAYNPDKLLWLNAHYIKNSPNDRLADLLHADHGISVHDHDGKEILLDVTKEKAKLLAELAADVKKVVEDPAEYNEKDKGKVIDDQRIAILKAFKAALLAAETPMHLPTDYDDFIKAFLETEGAKMPQLGQPLRLALFGEAKGMGMGEALAVLGKKTVAGRIDALLAHLEG